MHERRIYNAHPYCRWRTLRSRARSSQVYHTSYPVPVLRPASLDWGWALLSVALAFGKPSASRPHLTVTPCLSPILRLCIYLVWGFAPHYLRAMPGTHAGHHRHATTPSRNLRKRHQMIPAWLRVRVHDLVRSYTSGSLGLPAAKSHEDGYSLRILWRRSW